MVDPDDPRRSGLGRRAYGSGIRGRTGLGGFSEGFISWIKRSLTGASFSLFKAKRNSLWLKTRVERSSTALTASPGWMPAFSAGDPSTTATTTGNAPGRL